MVRLMRSLKRLKLLILVIINLKDYQLKAITSGHDALGEATVWIEKDGKIYSGRGLSTDVIEASVRAYIIAINKIVAAKDIKERKFQGGALNDFFKDTDSRWHQRRAQILPRRLAEQQL